jgi:hypothetical protein
MFAMRPLQSSRWSELNPQPDILQSALVGLLSALAGRANAKNQTTGY